MIRICSILIGIGVLALSSCGEEEEPAKGTMSIAVANDGGGLVTRVNYVVPTTTGNISGISDASATFRLENVTVGKYSVTLSKEHYATATKEIVVPAGTTGVTLTLESIETFLTLSDTVVHTDFHANQLAVLVEASEHWEATTSDSWITLSTHSSSGDKQMTITWDSIPEGDSRIGNVYFTCDLIVQKFRVVQE